MVEGSKFFMGVPKKMLFKVHKRKAIIIGCSEYENLAEISGKPYGNIEESLKDIKVVRQGLRRFAFKKKDIKTYINPDCMEVKFAISDAYREIYYDGKKNINTLLYVYYAGHGGQDGTTMCLLNDGKAYPLEKNLRSLAKMHCCYVIGVLDCCRERIRRGEMAMRGVGDEGEDEEEDALFGQPKDATENFIITYGC